MPTIRASLSRLPDVTVADATAGSDAALTAAPMGEAEAETPSVPAAMSEESASDDKAQDIAHSKQATAHVETGDAAMATADESSSVSDGTAASRGEAKAGTASVTSGPAAMPEESASDYKARDVLHSGHVPAHNETVVVAQVSAESVNTAPADSEAGRAAVPVLAEAVQAVVPAGVARVLGEASDSVAGHKVVSTTSLEQEGGKVAELAPSHTAGAAAPVTGLQPVSVSTLKMEAGEVAEAALSVSDRAATPVIGPQPVGTLTLGKAAGKVAGSALAGSARAVAIVAGPQPVSSTSCKTKAAKLTEGTPSDSAPAATLVASPAALASIRTSPAAGSCMAHALPDAASKSEHFSMPEEVAKVEVSKSARSPTPVSGLANIRTSPAPGSMARILADVASEAGQSRTPASHRISDVGSVGSEEPDEVVTPMSRRLTDASSCSRPTTPGSAHLAPRYVAPNMQTKHTCSDVPIMLVNLASSAARLKSMHRPTISL